jgi:hypothetical protein
MHTSYDQWFDNKYKCYPKKSYRFQKIPVNYQKVFLCYESFGKKNSILFSFQQIFKEF